MPLRYPVLHMGDPYIEPPKEPKCYWSIICRIWSWTSTPPHQDRQTGKIKPPLRWPLRVHPEKKNHRRTGNTSGCNAVMNFVDGRIIRTQRLAMGTTRGPVASHPDTLGEEPTYGRYFAPGHTAPKQKRGGVMWPQGGLGWKL